MAKNNPISNAIGSAPSMTRGQYDGILQALTGAQGMSMQTGSPLMAFLAPLAGGYLGRNAGTSFEGAQRDRDNAAIDKLMGLMGGGMTGGMAMGGAPGPSPAPAPMSEGAQIGADTMRALGITGSTPGTPPTATSAMPPPVTTGPIPSGTAPGVIPGIGQYSGAMSRPAPSLYGGGGSPTVSGDAGGDMLGGGMEPYRNAIASIESAGSGDYSAVGPTHSRLGRALGRYQIMEANIGPWSREALGREVSPDEFLANPGIQDAIFDAKFGGYVQQYGPQGAAQAWFAGPGGVGKTGRTDSLGTSVAEYTAKFNRAMGGGGSPSLMGGSGGDTLSGGPGLSRELLQMMTDPNISAPIRDIAAMMVERSMTQNGSSGMSPMDYLKLERERVGLDTDRARLEDLLAPDPVAPADRRIIEGADGFKYYEDTGDRVLPNISAPEAGENPENARQANVALEAIENRIQQAIVLGGSREEALWEIAQDPAGRRLLQIAGVDPNSLTPPVAPLDTPGGAAGPGFWSKLFGSSGGPEQPSDPLDPLGIR